MLSFLLRGLIARADDAVNLADLGMDGFTPYVTERQTAWALLPAVAVALLLVHLRRNRKKNTPGGNR